MIPYYIGDVMQAISQHRKPSKTHNPGFSSTDLFLRLFLLPIVPPAAAAALPAATADFCSVHKNVMLADFIMLSRSLISYF